MKIKRFGEFVVKVNRSNIELCCDTGNAIKISIRIAPEIGWLVFLKESAEKIWKDFEPKEAGSIGADYDEFYDSKTGLNGGLSINKKQGFVDFEVPDPDGDSELLYRFNKRKMESLIYDLEDLGYLKKESL